MAPKPTVNIVVVDGVGGPSLYIDNHRVAGPKPWGGGEIVKEWHVQRVDFTADMLAALGIKEPEPC